MRITCPSCNAQYEIGDDLIRPEGRDVQCSNCGTTWFQAGAGRRAAAVVRHDEDDVHDGDEEEDEDDAPDGFEDETPPSSHRPGAGMAALDILREERDREDRLRARPQGNARPDAPEVSAPPLERPDASSLGPREAAAAERVRMAAAATLARTRNSARAEAPPQVAEPEGNRGSRPEIGRDAAMPPGAGPGPGEVSGREEAPLAPDQGPPGATPARRGRITGLQLLPDIEEINSSLRPVARNRTRRGGEVAPGRVAEPAGRTGFRLGFLGTCALALVLWAVYAFAAPIGRSVPTLAEPVARYATWVDARRADLEGAVEALTERIAPDP